MSRRIHAAWLSALLPFTALLALTGCIEPSKIENADQLIAAASLRDGSVDLLPEAGGGGAGGVGGRSGAGGAGGHSGSGGAGGAAGAAAGNCGDVVATFILPTCATEFCHAASGTNELKLMTTDTAASLIGTDASMMCDGELYIDPDAPEKSLLYTKLGASPPCGLRMPFGGTPATDAQRACVLDWIKTEVAAAP